MSAGLLDRVSDWEGVEGALGQIRAMHDDFERFFTDLFDRMDDVVTRLAQRQQECERRSADQHEQWAKELQNIRLLLQPRSQQREAPPAKAARRGKQR